MFSQLKKFFYFPLSYYFRFFAKVRLVFWKPYIIVVTGSSGKTSLLHLLASQLGDRAKYSYLANSTYGISFDILGLKRKSLEVTEWLDLILKTPLSIFLPSPRQKIYIVEADCDRPGEGKYLASLLKPDITLWMGSGKTHTANFGNQVLNGKAATAEEAVAYEFGYFLEYTKELSIVNGDSKFVKMQLGRSDTPIEKVSITKLDDYKVFKNKTVFKAGDKTYEFLRLLPEEFFYALQISFLLLEKLKIRPDLSFKNFSLPPGRSNIFSGIKDTTIIDCTYNATPDGVASVLNMFARYPSEDKWLVLGDMIELGQEEGIEHEKLAEKIMEVGAKRIILVGPRLSKHTYPKLLKLKIKTEKFPMPKEALSYIKGNLKGGETVLFKGARFLEGIIEYLLADRKNSKLLPRREKVWEARRRKFGL